ncbi:MFS transporter [Acetonema longum]|uniref:Major facilitator superfamily protein n=1 Tax=Acetonema longum DSM 6540 TaxID=1009370 RepID=F7NMX0_9FIRM|nr:MFS transporter [Acetonema longum]EGO62614.1 major facilitator superfamily protein [Acetonema longum DSM 6540]
MENKPGTDVPIDGEKLSRKILVHLIPYLMFLYILAYIGRINFGYAALKMNADLGITDAQFGLIAGIFFIAYFIFEVPSNIILDKVGARKWIGRILFSWGLVAMATGLAQNVTHLYLARFILGAAEAGFFPGVILYLTFWLPQKERAKAVSMFMLGIPVSYFLGGPLSGAILDNIHWLGIDSWRWVFFLEGFPSVIFGFVVFFTLADGPKEVKWLSAAEKKWLINTLEEENKGKVTGKRHLSKETLLNKDIWLLAFVYFTIEIAEYAITFWSPILIERLSSFTSTTSIGWVNGSIYILGAATMILWGRRSDKKLERRWHTVAPMICCSASLLLLTFFSHSMFSVLWMAVIIASVYAVFGPFWSLPSMVLAGPSAAVGIAIINSCGNLAGFVSPNVIGLASEATGSVEKGFMIIAIFMTIATLFIITKLDPKKYSIKEKGKAAIAPPSF